MSGESYYKSIDSRQSPSKELPTKLLKQDRIKERQELSQTLHYDRDHLLKLKNRCVAVSQPGYVSKLKKINLINHTLSLVKTLKVLYVQNFVWWKYTIFPVYPKNLGIYHSFHKKKWSHSWIWQITFCILLRLFKSDVKTNIIHLWKKWSVALY